MKVTVRLMIFNPTTRKWRQHFSVTRGAPHGMDDVRGLHALISTDPPVDNLAVQLEEGGIIKLSADRGQMTPAAIAKLRRFVNVAIRKQFDPKPRPPRRG